MHLSEETVFIEAIGMQESGGNYTVVNSSSGALGKYQVMPANLAPWLKECHLPVVTPAKYLADPILQDQLAKCKLGGGYQRYGPRHMASIWYSGQPDYHKTYGDPPVYQYVADVIEWMRKISQGKISLPAPVEPTMPPPKVEDWHNDMLITSRGIHEHAKTIHGWNKAMHDLVNHMRG